MKKKQIRILAKRNLAKVGFGKLLIREPVLVGEMRSEVDEQGQLQTFIELKLNPAYAKTNRLIE